MHLVNPVFETGDVLVYLRFNGCRRRRHRVLSSRSSVRQYGRGRACECPERWGQILIKRETRIHQVGRLREFLYSRSILVMLYATARWCRWRGEQPCCPGLWPEEVTERADLFVHGGSDHLL